MRKIKTSSMYLVMIILMINTFPFQAAATSTTEVADKTDEKKYFVFGEVKEQGIPLFKESSEESEVLILVPDDTEVSVLEEGPTFTYISYTAQETGEVWMGYVRNQSRLDTDKAEEFRINRDQVESDNEVVQDENKESEDKSSINESVINKEIDDIEIEDIKESKGVTVTESNGVAEDSINSDEAEQKVNETETAAEPQMRTFRAFAQPKSVQTFKGIGLKSETNVYTHPSANSSILKSYDQGSVLKYQSFSAGWFSATVYIKGKATDGYIKASDVENIETSPNSLMGIGIKGTTSVYSKASRNSVPLKAYAQGSLLKYETFTSDWYKATVYVKGKAKTGYIHVNDVENANDSIDYRGVALNSPTRIYSKASVNSRILKSYGQGRVLKYQSLTSSWYKAYVYIKGKKTIGYIRKSDVENVNPSSTVLNVLGLTSKVNVYSYASHSARTLKFYAKGTVLKVRTFSSAWYECTVYVYGKKKTGYIRKKDVQGTQNVTNYNITLDDASEKQMNYSPVTDVNGSWDLATREQVIHYLNPGNFKKDPAGLFQFLILSSYAGTDVNEVNSKILNGKGILSGKASSFITAAKTHNINEIYLISHALLETGNGTSMLAQGIEVNGTTVYNVYGIGAYDQDPDRLGAEYAYSQGWTTIEKAIIGGAKFVSGNYIHAGQNTLYKMRWNPDAMVQRGVSPHQYATDIGWAVKQTKKMDEMYSMLTKYTLFFNVPEYK